MLKKILSIFNKPVIDPIPELLEEINALISGTQFAEAETMCRKKLTEHPYQPDLLCALGMCLGAQGKLDTAVLCFNQVLKQNPKHADSLKGLGNIAHLKEDYSAAADYYEQFLEFFPYTEDVVVNYANACGYIGSYERPKPIIENWIQAFPDKVAAHFEEASISYNLNHYQACISRIDKILEIDPQYHSALFMRSYMHMSNLNFTQAWRDYENRIKLMSLDQVLPFKRWDGQRLEKGLLIIRLEQGIGDNFMFARFLPRLNTLAKRMVVMASDNIIELFSDSFTDITFLKAETTVVELLKDKTIIADTETSEIYWLPLLSAPFVLGLKEISDLAMQHPYLVCNPNKTETMRSVLGKKNKLRIGITWRGNKARKDYKLRTLTEEGLSMLISADDSNRQIEWISLQNDEQPPQALTHKIRDMSQYLHNFADTAALIHELDAVISIDTSIAHLAGAMGISTYVLEPYTNDWRWRIGEYESPWYPATKLYKSERPDSAERWDKAIDKIKTDLHAGFS